MAVALPPAAPSTALGNPEGSGSPILTRRALLRGGTLALGGFSAAAVLAACAAPSLPGWTYGPPPPSGTGGPPSPGTSAEPSAATATGSPPPSAPAASSAVASGAPSSASPSAAPSGAPGGARAPSPADFAVPPPYHPRRSTAIEFKLTAHDGPGQEILIAQDHVYKSMNFDGQVPAPTLRVTEGETVRFTLTNAGVIAHSIDFHAAQTPWSKNYQSVAAGASFTFDWTAHHPGVFMYHCGSVPVLMHIGDGMYGAVIVDPKDGRPKAREYLIVQGEFYGAGGDYNAMLKNQPDVVCFNGQAFRYRAAPLTASVGELVRIFIVNAGPSGTSAFHVIGALFDAFEPEGNPANRMGMHQTVAVPPGDGAMVELRFPEAGTYPFVTHSFRDAERGATGLIKVA